MCCEVLVLHVNARDVGRAREDRSLLGHVEVRGDLPELSTESAGEIVDLESDRRMDRIQGKGPDRQRLPGVCRDAHLHSSLSTL